MRYVIPTAAVVSGGILAYIAFALSPEWTRLEWVDLFLASATFGALIVIGLAVATYGFFAGIEAAAVAGRDAPDTPPDAA